MENGSIIFLRTQNFAPVLSLDPLSLDPLSLDPLSLDPLSLDSLSLDPGN